MYDVGLYTDGTDLMEEWKWKHACPCIIEKQFHLTVSVLDCRLDCTRVQRPFWIALVYWDKTLFPNGGAFHTI